MLLVEYTPFVPKIITESLDPSKPFIVEGLLQRANAKNGNGRVYGYDVLKREIDKYQQLVKENRSIGELDHDSSNIINLKNVSHRILEIWWVGDEVYGRIHILDTPSGRILKTLIQEGVTVGISSRGTGSVIPLGETLQVQNDFELVCWDFVSNPSTQGAFMERVNESIIPTKKDLYKDINNTITQIICNRMGFCECEIY